MRYMSTVAYKRWFKEHKIFIGVVLAIIVLWATVGSAAWKSFDTAITTQEAANAEKLKEITALTKDIKTQKEAEEAKRLEEEQKAKEAAEAESKQESDKEVKPTTPADSGTGGCNTASAHTNPASIDVIVNKKHCLVPLAFVPPDLVTVNGATISAKAANDFNRMFADAAAAGQPFSVSSSYRSYTTQVSTYNYWVSVNGQQGADTVSARPGYSEHQTGLAVDVAAGSCTLDCFGSTSQYQWLQANAAHYGFIQRYYAGYEATTGYASEEWHYRYIGTAAAQDMKARGVKTLEQYWGLEGGDYH